MLDVCVFEKYKGIEMFGFRHSSILLWFYGFLSWKKAEIFIHLVIEFD